MSEGKKNNKKLLVIAGIAALAVVVSAVAVIWVTAAPGRKVAQGLMQLSLEIASYERDGDPETDMGEILEEWMYGQSRMVADVDLTLPGKEEALAGLYLDMATDREKDLSRSESELRISGKDILKLQVARDSEALYLAIPDLFDRSIQLDADSVVSALNNTWLTKLIGWEFPTELLNGEDPEAAYAALGEAGDLLAGAFAAVGLASELDAEDVLDLLEEIRVSSTDKTVSVESSWENVNWARYEVRMPARELTEQLQGELVWDVYLDESDRIMRIATAQPMVNGTNGQQIEFVVDLRGQEKTIDALLMTIYVADELQSDNPNEIEMQIRWNNLFHEGSDKPFAVQIQQHSGGKELSCEAQGTLKAVTADGRMTVQMDNMRISKEEKELCILSGELHLEILREEITMPRDSLDLRKYLR